MTNQDAAPLQQLFFHTSGTGTSPWEIHEPQPEIVNLVEQGVFHGKVLDIGCSIGDNTIYIAIHANSVKVTAIDMVPNALEVARDKAEKNNVNIQFEVVNMLDDLSRTHLKQHSYDVILDSAIFHVFSDDDRLRYIKNLEYLIKPDGLYIQLCFSEKETRAGGPRRIKKSDLDQLFSTANGWTIQSIKDTIYKTKPEILDANGRAYLTLIRRNKTI